MLLQVMLPPITLWAAMDLHSMFVLLAGVSLWLVSMYEFFYSVCMWQCSTAAICTQVRKYIDWHMCRGRCTSGFCSRMAMQRGTQARNLLGV